MALRNASPARPSALAAPEIPRETREFARTLLGVYAHATLTLMIALGQETGLWEVLARGPGTSPEIAARAGLSERYVREWLSAVAAAEFVDFDPRRRRFSLRAERAACLAGPSPYNMTPGSFLATIGVGRRDAIVRAFRRGGGVRAAAYLPEFARRMDDINRRRFDALLVRAYLPLARGLVERLERGARVVDVGCGTGHALHLMARAFPRSEFLGIDPSPSVLTLARREARRWDLTNVRYERRSVERLAAAGRFDVATMFDVIHDLPDPLGAVRSVRAALRPGGILYCTEPRASSRLAQNIGRPGAAYLYGISVSYCLPVARAAGGEGLGTAWGTGRARRLFRDAGFRSVRAHDAPANSLEIVYVARR